MVVINYDILEKSLYKSLNVGMAGYAATSFQVCSMMWLRTTMNYQFKNGGGTVNTIKKLYSEGGIPRFYRGVSFALINAPLSRFGDTAANMAATTYLEDSNFSRVEKTFVGSIGAGLWRVGIIPIESFKSHLQVHGKPGLAILKNKIYTKGLPTLWNGCSASFTGTILGHFPWFYTYNYLQTKAPYKDSDSNIVQFVRSGSIGFFSSAASDIVSNSVRVVKISKQTNEIGASYKEVVNDIIKKDNVSGLFLRGLKTKMLMNGIQGFVFVVIFDKLKQIINLV